MARAGLLVGIILVSMLLVGCAKRVMVRTDPPGAKAKVGEIDLGEVAKGGEEVRVPPGLDPVPYRVEVDGKTVEGELPRSDVNLWLLAAGVGAAACCAPTLALGGACLANPALATASLSCCLSGLAAGCTTANPVPCCTALAAPTWFTLPLAALGAAMGLSPLGLAFLAEEPPKEVTLPLRPEAPAEEGASEVPF